MSRNLTTTAPRRSTDAAAERHEPRFTEAAWLIAAREVSSRLRSKAFVISTIVLMAAVLASVILGSVFASNSEPTKVAVVGAASGAVADARALEAVPADDLDAAEAMLRDDEVSAIVAPTELVAASGLEATSGASSTDAAAAGLDITVIGLDQVPDDVARTLAVIPPMVVLDPAPADPLLAYLVAFGFGIVFFFSALTFGQTIAQSVVEEKQTRIIEILLSTVSARALLTGKVLGNSVMAFGQIIAIGALAIVGLAVTGQRVLLGGLGASVVWFVVFFVVGFVMLAALFAATAATVSRAEDIGSVTTPVTMLVMIPYFLIVFFNQNDAVVAVMSYVPFSAPIGMPVRIFLGTAQWWEPLVALAILVVTTVAIVAFGSRVYAGGLLRTGGRIKVREALRG
jgi:ABC-2 type transport system permease protein